MYVSEGLDNELMPLSTELKRYEVRNSPQSFGRKTAEESDNELFPNLR
jgi:hypothetical protein